MTTDVLLENVKKNVHSVGVDLGKGRDPRLPGPGRTNALTLQKNLDRLLGEREDAELSRLNELLPLTAESLRLIRAVASHFAPLPPLEPSGIWTFTHQGRSVSGRAPMPVSIKDSDTGWGVKVSALKDAAGEKADPGATVAFSVDDEALITITDNGDGSASFDSAIASADDSGLELPASTTLKATVTNPDGTSFDLEDVITVVAGAAVTGSFEFTPPA